MKRKFSGEDSEDLWGAISKVKNEKTNWALYELALSAQVYEGAMARQLSRLAQERATLYLAISLFGMFVIVRKWISKISL